MPSIEGASVTNPKLYFAYGSNLDLDDLRLWCKNENQPFPLKIGYDVARARALGVELSFSYRSSSRNGGVLDLKEREGQVVDGMLFEVVEHGWEVLDRKEGAPHCYERVPVNVCCDNDEMATVSTYTVVPSRRDPDGYVRPTKDYMEIVRRGRQSFGLDVRQLELVHKGETPALPANGTKRTRVTDC